MEVFKRIQGDRLSLRQAPIDVAPIDVAPFDVAQGRQGKQVIRGRNIRKSGGQGLEVCCFYSKKWWDLACNCRDFIR